MKIKALVILILSLFILCACSPDTDPVIPGPNDDGTNPSYDRLPSDEGGNDEKPSEEEADYVTIKAWDSVNKPSYYKTLNIKASGYKGNDYPNKVGEYYKIVNSYEQLCSLYGSVENVEPVLFEDFDLLILHRFYGSRGGSDIGFSEFCLKEDGSGQIKLCETGTTGAVDMVEYKSTEFILVPKNKEHILKEFQPINIVKETIYPYKVNYYDEIGVDLKGEALFFNSKQDYNKFAQENGLKTVSYGDKAILIIKNPSSNSWLYGPITLNGNELKLIVTETDSAVGFEEYGYAVIEIERYTDSKDMYSSSPYQSFEHNVNKEMSLNIQVFECPKAEPRFYDESDFGKALYDESESVTSVHTLYAVFNNRTVIAKRTEYKDGKKSHVVEEYIVNHDGEITTTITKRYHDYENSCYYEIENGIWKKYEGVFLDESLFSGIAFGNIGQKYSDLSYDIDTGAYYTEELKTYDTFYNFELKLFDTFVMSLSYEQYGRYSYEAIYQYNKITYFNRGNTKVTLPEENSDAIKEHKADKIDEETARRVAFFHARRYYGVLERRIEETLNYTSNDISDKDKNDYWFILFYENLDEYIYKISKTSGEIVSVSVSQPE